MAYKKGRGKYLKKAVRPVTVNTKSTVSDLLRRMGDTAFQGRNLGNAVDVWEEMLKTDTTVFFGLAGAMV
ncbi:MAG: deoxyhypusine synthase family protein, partial [Deltaproteobacteria bacterium]|nr:deoxyhypusine synthase family protein [Deltaproteobacteria bacterium]